MGSIVIALGILIGLFLARKKIVFGKRLISFQNAVFLFNINNLVIFGIGFVFLFPFMLLVSVGSSLRLMIILWYALIGIVSLISLFKPKLTFLSFIFFGLLWFHLYIDNPYTEKKTSYVDICNEMRSDSNCKEDKKQFFCHNSSTYGSKIYNKEICVNGSGGNDLEKYEATNSEYLGKTVVTENLFFYLKNLPRNNCRNRTCGYMYDTRLVDWDNNCGNCLGENRVSTPIRIEPVRIGTQIKVTNAYKLVPKYPMGKTYTMLVLEDSEGNKSELLDFEFKSHFISNIKSSSGRMVSRNKILETINALSQGQLVTQYMCLTLDDFKNPEKHGLDPSFAQFSKYIELRLLKFMASFRLENEMKVTDTLWRKTEKNVSDKPASYPIRTCTKVIFKSVASYLLYTYYREDWGVFVQTLNDSDIALECLPKEYETSNSTLCEKLEGQLPFTLESWNDLEKIGGITKYKRTNEDDYLK
jgi:hypothetical protein